MPVNKWLLWSFAALVIPASCVFKGVLIDDYNREYLNELAELRVKLDPELTTAGSRRILIAGGSNAASGYDSTAIMAATGHPTFNLSLLDEGMNYRNVLEVVEQRARRGDLVVLSSLRFFASHKHGEEVLTRTFGPDRWRQPTNSVAIQIAERRMLISFAPLFSEMSLVRTILNARQWRDSVETQRAAGSAAPLSIPVLPAIHFDTRGDWINCQVSKQPAPLPLDPAVLEQSTSYLDALAAFSEYLDERGVTLRIAMPTVLIREDDRQRWESQLKTMMHSGRPLDFLPFDPVRQLSSNPSRFCDSSAHLIRSEAQANSEPLIREANRVMAEPTT